MTEPNSTKVSVLLVIQSLGMGGAERQVVELAKGISRDHFDIAILTLRSGGAMEAELTGAPWVRLLSLKSRGRLDTARVLWRAIRVARSISPDVIHGYLPVGNIFSLLLGRAVRACVIWGIRASVVESARYRRRVGISLRLAAALSRFPDLIIANSHAGKLSHVADGFPADKIMVIHNGIDTSRFKPRPELRTTVRREWNLDLDAFVIGQVGRLDPMKDHESFFRAVARVSSRGPESLAHGSRPAVAFVCVGTGTPEETAKVKGIAKSVGVADLITWIPHVRAMERVYSALDLLSSTSAFGEGFPNVVGEALSSGLPCVVTDVGDSARIVGDCGAVATVGDVAAIAAAWEQFIAKSPAELRALGARARKRAEDNFAVSRMVQATEAALQSVLTANGRHNPASQVEFPS